MNDLTLNTLARRAAIAWLAIHALLWAGIVAHCLHAAETTPAAVEVAKPVEVIRGKVVAVSDGDTLTVLTSDKVQHKIRLAGVDAPELGKGLKDPGQPHAQDAKQALSAKVFGETVLVELGAQTYDRRVGRVLLGESDVSEFMLNKGWAWHYVEYSKDKHLAELEQSARQRKVGLWVDRDPTPPWEHRRAQKAARDKAKAAP